jgi:hypothetical protein
MIMKALSKNPMILAGTNSVSTQVAQKSGNEANGSALADLFVREVKSQATSMKRYLQDVAALSQDGRKAFRSVLIKHRAEMSEHVKASGNDEVFRKAYASAKARISEAIGYSSSIDDGFAPDFSQSYHTIIAQGVTYRKGKASAGIDVSGPTTLTRGRKADPFMIKLQKFIERCKPTDDELKAAALALSNGFPDSVEGEEAPF